MTNALRDMAYDYTDIAGKLRRLSEGEDVHFEEEEIAFALEEGTKRRDGDTLLAIAVEWFQILNGDDASYAALLSAAAEGGSVRAHFWLAEECRRGRHMPLDYEKSYACYKIYDLKGDGVLDKSTPIDPEMNPETMRILNEYGIPILEICDPEVIARILLDTGDYDSQIEESIPWWEFVLKRHPSRALKCGLGNWYVNTGDFAKGFQLIEESANEGFSNASSMLALYYSDDAHKDVDKARHWLNEAEKSGAQLPYTAKKLGVECEAFRCLKADAQRGDLKAAAVLAAAYYHGSTDGRYGEPIFSCGRDLMLAREYGELACVENEGADILFDLLDTDKKDECEFFSELTQDLEVEEPLTCRQRSTNGNELVQDEEGNWGYV